MKGFIWMGIITGVVVGSVLIILSVPELIPVRGLVRSLHAASPGVSFPNRTLTSSDLATDPQIESLVIKANLAQARLDQVKERFHLKPSSFSSFKPTWGSIDQPMKGDFQIAGPSIKLSSPRWQFSFRQEDNSLINYSDDRIPRSDDGSGKPTWTPKQALEIAKAFREALIDPSSTALLGNPTIEYTYPAYNGSKKTLGYWEVFWPRVDKRGNPFFGDHVTLDIEEERGLTGVFLSLSTPFVENAASPMDKAGAIAKARHLVFWKQTSKRFHYLFGSYDDYEKNVTSHKVKSAELMVVVPFPLSVERGSPITTATEARLGWEIWFEPIHAAPPKGSVYDDRFSIWIDAYTGEVIGGDAML